MRDARRRALCDLGFPILCEPSAAVEPRNRPFDDPTAWKHSLARSERLTISVSR